MADLLTHRGPDDAGMLVDPPAVLGHRRLAILDLSPAGHQPMSTEDGRLWIVYNGEIYNYVELGKELRALGHRLHSSCDTEVLLHAYAQWGPAALSRLNGMFAFAVWDRRSRQIFCARDRFGVKPFYYAVAANRFRFASEIKALLLDPAVPRVPNDARVLDFLAHGLADHTAETMFAGIEQLPPGSFMVVTPEGGVERPTSWYRPKPAQLNGQRSEEAVRERLVDAVRLRLRSDVPLGTALSGGLDSSSVTAIASALLRAGGRRPPDSFLARCRNPRIDEARYAMSVVRRTGSRNHEVLPDDLALLEDLDSELWHMDEPFHAASVYGQRRVHQLARSNGVIVLLDGQGGDEAFSGYHYLHYAPALYSLWRAGKVARAASELAWRRRLHGKPISRTVVDMAKLAGPRHPRKGYVPAWINRELAVPPRPLPGRSFREHQLYGLRIAPLPAYNHHEDRNSMAFALEARNPFLDWRVVECGLALGPEDLLRRGMTKWALRQAMRGVVPEEILERRDKQGFSTDQVDWLRGALGDVFEETFSRNTRERPYFDRKELVRALERHRADRNLASQLWRAFIVERWLQLFFDEKRSSPPPSPTTPRSAARAVDRVTRLVAVDTPAPA